MINARITENTFDFSISHTGILRAEPELPTRRGRDPRFRGLFTGDAGCAWTMPCTGDADMTAQGRFNEQALDARGKVCN